MKRSLRPIVQDTLICIIIIQFILGSGLHNVPLAVINLIVLVFNIWIISKYGKDLYE